MKRSPFFSTSRVFIVAAALVIVLSIFATSYFLSRQRVVPITGGVSPVQKEVKDAASEELVSGVDIAPALSAGQPQQSLSSSYVEDLLSRNRHDINQMRVQPSQSLSSSYVEDLLQRNRHTIILEKVEPPQSLSSSYVEDLLRQNRHDYSEK